MHKNRETNRYLLQGENAIEKRRVNYCSFARYTVRYTPLSIELQDGDCCGGEAQQLRKMEDLLLDPAIRLWVIVPIFLITFLVGVIRHHASILLQSATKLDVEQVKQR